MPEILQQHIKAVVTLPGTALPAGSEFTTFAGGKVTAPVERDRSPSERFDHPVVGLPTIEPITVSRVVNTQRDLPIIKALKQQTGAVGSVGEVLRDSALNRVGTETYIVTLTEVEGPDGDTMSTDKARFTLTFEASLVV